MDPTELRDALKVCKLLPRRDMVRSSDAFRRTVIVCVRQKRTLICGVADDTFCFLCLHL